MKNKEFLFLFIFLLVSCSEVTDEALKAGFKSDANYQKHLNDLRIKRDSSFKEKILYASNIASFDTDNQYEAAIYQLEKSRRKYISQDGVNNKLLYASNKLLTLNNEFTDYQYKKYNSLEAQYDCIEEVGDEPLKSDYGTVSYDLVKSAWDIKIMLCKLETDTYGVSPEFISSHTAARKLVNSNTEIDTKDDAEILFNKFLLDALNDEG